VLLARLLHPDHRRFFEPFGHFWSGRQRATSGAQHAGMAAQGVSLSAHLIKDCRFFRRNGPIDVPEGLTMNDVLHEMLGLTGSRLGCGIGICHACVVIWDRDDQTSEEVQTCITGAGFFDGKRIRTVEGIKKSRGGGAGWQFDQGSQPPSPLRVWWGIGASCQP
jgi:hypothetical protein